MRKWAAAISRSAGFLLVTAGWLAAVPGTSWKEAAGRARVLQQNGKFCEAEALLLQELKDAQAHQPEDGRIPILLNNLASVCQDLGRVNDAERYYRQSIAWIERTDQGTAPIRQLHNLASLLSEHEDFVGAERLERRALALFCEDPAQTDGERDRLVHGLAYALHGQERVAEAETLYRQALAAWETSQAHQRDLSDLLNNLGLLCSRTGTGEEGLADLRRSVAILERTLGPGHPSLVIRLNTLATIYAGLRRPAEAEILLARALPLAAATFGSKHEIYGRVLLNYLAVLRQMNRKREAHEMGRRAIAILASSGGFTGARHTVEVSECLDPVT